MRKSVSGPSLIDNRFASSVTFTYSCRHSCLATPLQTAYKHDENDTSELEQVGKRWGIDV